MKNIIILILLAATITLGVFCVHQQKQIAQSGMELAGVQNQFQSQLAQKSEADEEAARAEERAKNLKATLTETAAVAGEQSRQVTQLQLSLAAAKTNGVNPLGEMSEMFKDPEMRDMIKSSQKAFMGPVLDKQYAAFIPQLNVTPDQAAALKDLLQNKMLAGTDARMALMDDSLDASQRADLSKQMKSETDDSEAQIKQYLGDEYYSIFQSYEKTIPDRMTVSDFNDQLASGSAALSDDQQRQLIQALNSARTSFKWTTDYSQQSPADGDMGSRFTDDKINQFAQETEQFNQQFLTQAQQILTPDQAATFAQFQTAQNKMQIAGMKIAARMFAPKSQ